MNDYIQAQSLAKTYKNGVQGLKTLDLSVAQGEVFAFLGPNGAGKTTTVRLLNGTLQPSQGTCTIGGIPAHQESARATTATMSEEAHMYEALSFQENLIFYASLYGISKPQATIRAKELATQFHLQDRLDHQIGGFSTGMKKRANLARCLIHRPKILFLDEPTSGLDPQSSKEVMEIIGDLAKNHGTTIFMCTHNLPLVEAYCHRMAFIKQGALVAVGTKEDLIAPILGEPQVTITLERQGQTVSQVHTIQGPHGLNQILSQLMAQGDIIQEVHRRAPDLEAVYQHYITDQGAAV